MAIPTEGRLQIQDSCPNLVTPPPSMVALEIFWIKRQQGVGPQPGVKGCGVSSNPLGTSSMSIALVIQSDKASVVWNVNMVGSTMSTSFQRMTIQFFKLINKLHVKVRDTHSGDSECNSRCAITTEWNNLEIFQCICQIYRTPGGTPLASQYNAQLPFSSYQTGRRGITMN